MEIVIHSSRLKDVIGVYGVKIVIVSDWKERSGFGFFVDEAEYIISKLPDPKQQKDVSLPDHSYKAVKERTKFFGRRK